MHIFTFYPYLSRKKTRHRQGKCFACQANVIHSAGLQFRVLCKGSTSLFLLPLPAPNCFISFTDDFFVLMLSSVWYTARQLWAYYRRSHLWKAEGCVCTVALLVWSVVSWWCSRARLKLLVCCRSASFILENLVWTAEHIPQQLSS